MKDFKSKLVLVTGASSGIGEAFANQICRTRRKPDYCRPL